MLPPLQLQPRIFSHQISSISTVARKPFGRLRTIDETAEILNVSSRTVRRLIDSGTLPVHRFSRSVRISDPNIAR
jgi:excisionase family DNA binding protein